MTGWDIVVDVRTAIEDEQLMRMSECAELPADLVSLEINAARRIATYSVSAQESDTMNLLWDRDCRAKAAADAIIEQIMGEDGLLDSDGCEDDEAS